MGRTSFLLLLVAGGCRVYQDTGAVEDTDTGEPDTGVVVDADADGFAEDVDCDDTDDTVFPGAPELCDGVDNDCNGEIDDSADEQVAYADDDEDGFGDPELTATGCDIPAGFVANADDCDDSDPAVNPDAVEACDGIDNDCDPSTPDGFSVEVNAGSLTGAASYQYSPVTPQEGFLEVHFVADGPVELAVGTTPGAQDVMSWTAGFSGSSATLAGLSLQGAWDDVTYYVSARADLAGSCPETTSEGVQIAEAEVWRGDVADLRPPDDRGGYNENWPETGFDAVYGEHWFERVDIGSNTEVYVQGWGREDNVQSGVSANDAAVTDPVDGWLHLYANSIEIDGFINASGRGYGGGGGAGSQGGVHHGAQGRGGSVGLGGLGGEPAGLGDMSGMGGDGSPAGRREVSEPIPVAPGGLASMLGGGGGSGRAACGPAGNPPGDAGDGTIAVVGGNGESATFAGPGGGGDGERARGGGDGGFRCNTYGGGGGGGYGAGGGAGVGVGQLDVTNDNCTGGGGGGTGGEGGQLTGGLNGGGGAGPFGGSGGLRDDDQHDYTDPIPSGLGDPGGYAAPNTNGDATTDTSLRLGSGGGGGGAGRVHSAGGGGGAGGGAVWLEATESISLGASSRVAANGAGAGGGGFYPSSGGAFGHQGGAGAGGGLCLRAPSLDLGSLTLFALGGDGSTSNGGTIKLFYDELTGSVPSGSAAGRVYDAGPGSYSGD